jgi:hypothetical protein
VVINNAPPYKNALLYPIKKIGNFLFYQKLAYDDKKAGRQLDLVQNNLDAIQERDIILFCCLRNEQFRMPFFARYYRNLGVRHFLVVDNGSTDSFPEWAKEQPDFSVWRTTASYRDSRFGMLWLNDLLRRHGAGHWCVAVDPDEFLVYPYMETRSLRALANFLEEEKRHCFHAVLLDAYSDRNLEETILEEASDPFAVCQFFDSDGYIQVPGWGGSLWVRGGPRLRIHSAGNPNEAPALNKIPFIKWRSHFHYRRSTHDARPLYLNKAHTPGEVSPTGALFHFKMVAPLLGKAEEEMKRSEHYAGGREYKLYLEKRDLCCYEPDLSVRYENPRQLIELGIMSPGKWF